MNSTHVLLASLWDWDWWKDGLLSWLVFSVGTGAVVSFLGKSYDGWRNRRFEGWELHILHQDGKVQNEAIYSEDVRRCLASRFELLKFVKSYFSNSGLTLTVPLGQSPFDEDGKWIREAEKRFEVDLVVAKKRGHVKVKSGKT